ncbi:MAG TPA: hypothetical protein VFT31_17190 [Kribbella sp.]|nr:hypothetical protein [Kribbella sp.]
MVLRVGLPALVMAVALAWFAYASYRRAQLAEQAIADLREEARVLEQEVRALERAVAAAEQGLRTLASHPSVPRDVALTADLTLADIRRLIERKELDH